MSMTFTKLFSSITESTIWVEPYATRIVWVSMLAMADRKGRVWASIPGLARRSGVTLEEAEAALARFQQPDKYSRTPDNEGRRIIPIDGGWELLNYEKYRAIRDEETRREYQRDWDRTHRGRKPNKPDTPDKSDKTRPPPTQAEAEAEEEKTNPKEEHTGGRDIPASPSPPRALPAEGPLTKAELGALSRELGVKANGFHPLVIEWAMRGVTERQLRSAMAVVRTRDGKATGEISPAYLNEILLDVMAGKVAGARPTSAEVIAQTIANINAKEAGNARH